MKQQFVCLGNWIDKTDKTPKSRIAEVKGGTSKNGSGYEFAEVETARIVDGTYAVGEILHATLTLQVNTPFNEKDKKAA